MTSDFGQIIKVKIFSKVEYQDLLIVVSWYFIWVSYLYETSRNIRAMISWPIFHGPLTSDFGQISKVKIFVQGRILRLKFY